MQALGRASAVPARCGQSGRGRDGFPTVTVSTE